jgi:hypothetical protein
LALRALLSAGLEAVARLNAARMARRAVRTIKPAANFNFRGYIISPNPMARVVLTRST